MRKTTILNVKLTANDYIDAVVARNIETFYKTPDCADYVSPKALKFMDKKIGQNLKEQFSLVKKIKKEEIKIATILSKDNISFFWKLFHRKLWKIIKDSEEFKRKTAKLKKKIKVKKTKKKLVIKSRKKDSNTKTAV